ncbi:unnamed protein product [Sphagnum troendelagicum]
MDHQQQATAASWAPFGTCQSTPSLWEPDRSGLRTQASLPLLPAAAGAAPGGARYQVQLPTTYVLFFERLCLVLKRIFAISGRNFT